MSNFDDYHKCRLDFATVWESFVFWVHGVLRPSHHTCLVISASYVVPMCEQCEKKA